MQSDVHQRVIYNITNVPVDSYVVNAQEMVEAIPVESAAETKDIQAQVSPEEPARDNLEQYWETDGPVDRWQGDAYLADVLEQAAAGAESTDATRAESRGIPTEDGSDPKVFPSTRQPVFFGPAEDRYEDLVSPAFAETPFEAQKHGSNGALGSDTIQLGN
jgi:hypothetical protein